LTNDFFISYNNSLLYLLTLDLLNVIMLLDSKGGDFMNDVVGVDLKYLFQCLHEQGENVSWQEVKQFQEQEQRKEIEK